MQMDLKLWHTSLIVYFKYFYWYMNYRYCDYCYYVNNTEIEWYKLWLSSPRRRNLPAPPLTTSNQYLASGAEVWIVFQEGNTGLHGEERQEKTVLQRDENGEGSPWRTLYRWWGMSGLCPCLVRSE
jgi:hypothetical protein